MNRDEFIRASEVLARERQRLASERQRLAASLPPPRPSVEAVGDDSCEIPFPVWATVTLAACLASFLLGLAMR